MSKRVILHIGHGKTGTSAIQAFLKANVEALEGEKVRYPLPSSLDRAGRRGITSGNSPDDPGSLFDLIDRELDRCPEDGSLLFSSEVLFWKPEDICARIAALRGDVEFEIVLFIRNPVDMARSAYNQAVKRDGETLPFEDYAISESHLLIAEKWHRDLADLGVTTRVLNYSRIDGGVISAFLGASDCAPILRESVDVETERRTVNRSLSSTELHVVRIANRDFGKQAGWAVSRRLIETSPKTTSVEEPVSDDLFAHFEARFRSAIDYFDDILPQSAQLALVTPRGTAAAPGSKDPDGGYLSIAAAMTAMQAECEALSSDIAARRSRLADRLDWWDYRLHRTLGKVRFLGDRFGKRFEASAKRRHRRQYDG